MSEKKVLLLIGDTNITVSNFFETVPLHMDKKGVLWDANEEALCQDNKIPNVSVIVINWNHWVISSPIVVSRVIQKLKELHPEAGLIEFDQEEITVEEE